MKQQILGVNIDDITIDQALEKALDLLNSPGKHYIVTPNPEFLLAAGSDSEFKEILNEADLSLPDGAGLKLSGKINNTVSGTDLMEKLILVSEEKAFTIGLIGGRNNIAVKLKKCLLKKYPNLKVLIADGNFEVNNLGEEAYGSKSDQKTISEVINNTQTNIDFLFVAFGQVKQEKWIFKNLLHLNVKVAMGVGGAFDYLSGEVPRAPLLMRSLGLEWLFRLITQPWRIFRILGLVKYLYLIINKLPRT